MNTESPPGMRTAPFAPGERVNHWTVVAPVLPAPKRFSQWVYWARPDCCGVVRQVSYRTLNNKRIASGLCIDCSDRYRAEHGRNKTLFHPPAPKPPSLPVVPVLNRDNWISRLPVATGLKRDVWGHPCLSS